MDPKSWLRLDRRVGVALLIVAFLAAALGLGLLFTRGPDRLAVEAALPKPAPQPAPPARLESTEPRYRGSGAVIGGLSGIFSNLSEEQIAFCATSGLNPRVDPQSCELLVAAVQSGRRGLITYKVPKTMLRGETHPVAAILTDAPEGESEKVAAANRRMLELIPGTARSETTMVHTTMSARLTGNGFEIEALSPEKQTIVPGTSGRWDWSVEPLQQGGTIRLLRLTAQAHISVDGEESAPLQIETFERQIAVEVRWIDQIGDLVGDAQVLQGAGAVLIVFVGWAAWLYRRARGRRRQEM